MTKSIGSGLQNSTPASKDNEGSLSSTRQGFSSSPMTGTATMNHSNSK